ncbi:hypothetical protein [Chrysiogenes arsenatis]|uniref:hypothetical protein n=1 Tax=Chrysiogenes arsenatis TaxID=309797 RepID=UPI000480D800|nr:hypothetical protein [Chrysiogenes arsenatis]
MKRILLSSTLVAALLLGGCATKDDVRTLQNQIAFLNQKLEKTSTESQAKLQGIQQDQERLRPTITRSQLDISLRIEQIEREVANLTNALETNARQSTTATNSLTRQLETQNTELRAEIATQIKQSHDQQTLRLNAIADSLEALRIAQASRPAPAVASPSTAAATKTPSKQATDEKPYDYARRLYRENKHSQLKQEYAQIYASAPAGEKPGIMYWYGSSVLTLNEFRDAALIFDDLIKKYPSHWSVPFSLLKQGHAFRGLGDNKSAELFYRRVLAQHGSSDAAKHAKTALEQK